MCSSFYSKKSRSPDDFNNADSTESSLNEERLTFSSAPRLCKSVSVSPCSLSYRSDSSISDSKLVKHKRRNKRRNARTLPPIGIFWDIENCQVPKGKSAISIVQRIRELLYDDYREVEFLVVCDVKKESPQIITDLHDAQVNLIHVSSTSKNAADEKLRQSLRRFAEIYKTSVAIALISSDINFAADLSDLRYRKKMYIILIHNNNVADGLILCANKAYSFTSITESIPEVFKNKVVDSSQADLYVTNLPLSILSDSREIKGLKVRLKLLSDNCGGKIVHINKILGIALIRFTSLCIAKRAQKRLEGENVFGNKIHVSNAIITRESPFKSVSGRKVRNNNTLYEVPPVPLLPGYGEAGMRNCISSKNSKGTWNIDGNKDLASVQQPHLQLFRPIRGSGFMETSQNHYSSENVSTAATLSTINRLMDSTSDSQPFSTSKNLSTITSSAPIELIISNLDSAIDLKQLRAVLLNMLKQYAVILNITISVQSDGSPIANIKIGSQQEAQFVISQLHHQWLGCKRMKISYAQSSSDSTQLRSMIIALLQEVPGKRMPLFKFIELAESRYHCAITLSEVNKLKDVCKIVNGHSGRMISLTPEASISPPLLGSNLLLLYCSVHCPDGLESRGWGEVENVELPNVRISLKLFSNKIKQLLMSHMGQLSLLSFPVCYAAEFGQPLPQDESGVPLEHLVVCIPNVELSCSSQNKNVKYLKLKIEKEKKVKDIEDPLIKSVSPSLMTDINMLCREIVDLLKVTDRCQLLLNRFIPAYHHHFGRQCRVATYGFTRLIDLFEAISHVVQIMGSSTKRVITLTHSAQMRRFTSDLLKVLKCQMWKQVTITDFPMAYEKVLHRTFNPVEYGLCSLEDLLQEVPDSTVIISRVNNTVTIAIPKREQTSEELQRTKQFALEVVELLRHSPYCSMLFNKFVPAYHHHFGRQCKVSDYGFTKLAELFESIPDTVELEGSSDIDRKVKLKLSLKLKVLGNQIQTLIKESRMTMLPVDTLLALYKQNYGYTVKPQDYACREFGELMSKLEDFIQIIRGSAGPLLTLTDIDTQTLEIRVWALLLSPPHSTSLMTFIHNYRLRFFSTLSMIKLEQLNNVVILLNNGSETIVTLTKNYVLAAQFYHLLYVNGGSIELNAFMDIYCRKFGKMPYISSNDGYTLEELCRKMDFLLTLKEVDNKTFVVLNKELVAYGINLPLNDNDEATRIEEESFSWSPPISDGLINYRRGIAPPKPDTPPDQNDWTSFWNTSQESESLNLSIPLQSIDIAKVLMDTKDLISPTRNLLSATHSYTLNANIPKFTVPHPTDLPLPDKLVIKDDSSDSGVNSSKHEFTLSYK